MLLYHNVFSLICSCLTMFSHRCALVSGCSLVSECFFLFCKTIELCCSLQVYPEVILPGIVSGVMWGIACACWFISNAELSEAVSFPIVGVAPAAIASLVWGVIIFREIKVRLSSFMKSRYNYRQLHNNLP